MTACLSCDRETSQVQVDIRTEKGEPWRGFPGVYCEHCGVVWAQRDGTAVSVYLARASRLQQLTR